MNVTKMLGALYSPTDTRDYSLRALGIPVNPNAPVKEYEIIYQPNVYDQGSTMKCVAFSGAGVMEAIFYKQLGQKIRFSPDKIYGNRIDMTHKGEGMYLRDAAKSITKYGTVYENDFRSGPLVQECIFDFEKRKEELLNMALPYRTKVYIRFWNVQEVVKFLETFNIPVLGAFNVYSSINQTTTNGIIPEPSGTFWGGHAIQVVGTKFINGQPYFKILNSWGTNWGAQGYGYLHVDHLREVWGLIDQPSIFDRVEPDVISVDTIKKTLNAWAKEEQIISNKPTNTINHEGRIYLQMRDIFETLNWDLITWNNTTKIATFRKNSPRF